MNTALEFYSFEDEVWVRKEDGETFRYTENDTEITKLIYDKLESFYPKALVELRKICKESSYCTNYFRHRVALRFCRCNFGVIDNNPDINRMGQFTLEHVTCPLRGECRHENIVCNPEFNHNITAGEMRVMELLYRNVTIEDVADKLCLSPHTARNHKRNAMTRLGLHSMTEFVHYAHEHKLFI